MKNNKDAINTTTEFKLLFEKYQCLLRNKWQRCKKELKADFHIYLLNKIGWKMNVRRSRIKVIQDSKGDEAYRYYIYHVKFNICLVSKPLEVFSSETKWLNASLLFLRMNYVKNV